MRLLLDEGFPTPARFRPEDVDASLEVVPLRELDPALAGSRTPDWYLYLRAHEAGFDALVTRDWHQSEQSEELWTLTRTELSIVTWKRPVEDPIREWGQLLAYLPEIRRVIGAHGPSIVFLPSPRLSARPDRASQALGRLANERRLSTAQVMQEARTLVRDELAQRGEMDRFEELVA